MYRRLLVPLDGSCLAETSLVVVERLAAVYRATVALLHVIERRAPATWKERTPNATWKRSRTGSVPGALR